jgi:hypothetical protein
VASLLQLAKLFSERGYCFVFFVHGYLPGILGWAI